ncbi:ADP-heptose--LPS heptosyltransferase [Pararobbsia alpina]|uniref:ADP-heptose--LPS heptosyltransferase 2 n=1 Tax=Pararobbsia alpina TaxID=621374 RepID=A0A6S7AVJ3_9BURK|nr:ADP-heptose--LPS heptosyltransferase [Pararobbsia alpina]CAB3779124.1 hypothetical protein LMG28138_00801 [Pararobbsia alpina]
MSANIEALYTHPGSWVSAKGLIEVPYDLERNAARHASSAQARSEPTTAGAGSAAALPGPARPLTERANVYNAARERFTLPVGQARTIHIVNAMGVVLGDSIIGLSVLRWLRDAHPQLELRLYRAANSPDYVEHLYRLAAGIVGEVRHLPWPIDAIPAGEPIVDIGNIAYWPRFSTQPMVDFFCEAMGIDPAQVPASAKSNRWLAELVLPPLPEAWRGQPYVLFSPAASTPVRRIPRAVWHRWIDRLWDAYGLPVLGFVEMEHPHFVDLRAMTPDTSSFLMWVKHAQAMVTADSAAVHVAAGFDVPTTAIFTTIDPRLRVRDYPRCTPVDLAIEELRGMHSSDLPQHVALVERAWSHGKLNAMPLPTPIDTPAQYRR